MSDQASQSYVLPVTVRAWAFLTIPTTLWVGGLLIVLAVIG